MKREIATTCLQLGDHRVIVDAGSRAESHWLGLGYGFAGGSVSGDAASADQDDSKRRGRPKRRAESIGELQVEPPIG